MKTLMTLAAATFLTATPLLAQGLQNPDTRGYVTGAGGFASGAGSTTGDVLLDAGIRVAPHLTVFGSIGRFGNLQADLQPTLDAATASLASNQGLTLTGGGTLPARYGLAGLRFALPTHSRISPYVLGGIGVAHLAPSPQFTFADGLMPDGSTPAVGTDVTSALVTSGSLTTPATSHAFMFTAGGGVQIPLAPHWLADAGYRYSRIAADTTLSASPLNTNGLTFGVGYRF